MKINKKRNWYLNNKRNENRELNYNCLDGMRLYRKIDGLKNCVYSICMTKDRRLAVSSIDKNIKIFDLETYKCDLVLSGHDNIVRHISTLNNECLISSSYDKTMKIWEIGKDFFKCIKTLLGHSDWVKFSFQISNDRIISGSNDQLFKIWSSVSYKCLKTIDKCKSILTSAIELKNKQYIVTSTSSSISFWDNVRFEQLKEIKEVFSLSENSMIELDNENLMVGSYQKIFIINSRTFSVETTVKISNKKIVSYISFLEVDKNRVLVGSTNGYIRCLDKNTYTKDGEAKAISSECVEVMIPFKNDMIITYSSISYIYIWKLPNLLNQNNPNSS